MSARIGYGRPMRGLTALLIALPAFVLGPVLSLVLGLRLRWLPAAGWNDGSLGYAVLPVLTLAAPALAYSARLARTGLLEVLGSDYIRAARASGLGLRRIVVAHALRPALLPLVHGTVRNLETVGLPDALTGPISRGDLGTVKGHLAALRRAPGGQFLLTLVEVPEYSHS